VRGFAPSQKILIRATNGGRKPPSYEFLEEKIKAQLEGAKVRVEKELQGPSGREEDAGEEASRRATRESKS